MDDSTPAHPPHRVPRRVATAPIPLSASMQSPDSDSLVETLYNHPNAKIISFTASGRAFSRSPGGPVFSKDEEPGTLSWSSQLERTIAVGPFRIYRAPGSVAFLNCGSALQPILPKSQCWCIDEINSKFVLQIRRPNYWRIELPVGNPEEKHRAEALRDVFDNILQFEKTECPFKRSFTVELEPQTPIKKIPWSPMQGCIPPPSGVEATTPASSTDSRRSSFGARTSTPTPLSNRHQYDMSTSPLSSRPTSSASCAPSFSQQQVAQWESRTRSKSLHTSDDDFVHSLRGLPEEKADKRPQSPALEPPPAEGPVAAPRPADPFLSTRSGTPPKAPSIGGIGRFQTIAPIPELDSSAEEAHDSSLFSTETQSISSDRESPMLSARPVRETRSVFELHEGTGYRGGRMKARLRRTAGFAMTRSVTLPPHMMFSMDKPSASQDSASPPKKSSETTVTDDAHESVEQPLVENKTIDEPRLLRRDSEESFHSVESWHSSSGAPAVLSPPTSQPESPIEGSYDHEEMMTLLSAPGPKDKLSEGTGSSGMPCAWESDSDDEVEASLETVATAPGSSPTPSVRGDGTGAPVENANDEPAAASPQRRPATRHRATTTSISVRRRALSPLPPAANLFTPLSTAERRPYESKLQAVKNLPMAIISKTVEMFLGPPSHLIKLMLKVAAKIVAGEWRGLVYGYNDDGEQIPVQWDYSEGEFSDWSDDEPYMSSHFDHRGHHGHHGHRERRHHRNHSNSNHGQKNQKLAAADPVAQRPVSSDGSRSSGVD